MADTEQDKSEQPTPYKLERSRKKGIVARGMDLSFLTGLAALFLYAWMGGGLLGRTAERAAHDALVAGTELTDSNASLLSAMGFVFAPMLRPMLLLFFTIFLVVLVFEVIQTGVVFSTEPLKPDFSRLNPANGLKRVFSLRLLIETFKNILKFCVYSTIAFLVIRGVLQSDIRSVVDGRGLLDTLRTAGLRLLSLVLLAAVLFMILDQIISRGQFLKKMRMNRRELRQEAREREGEPRLKQKRKQLHREFAKASQSMRGLKKADVLVTNPQHIALALQYQPGLSTAPMVVSVGINQFAQRLKRMAFLYGIPIVENKALARELYAKSALNRPIPENCYKPVADIYNSIRRKMRARDGE
jgi:flagellar biosynthetic protein FlhB